MDQGERVSKLVALLEAKIGGRVPAEKPRLRVVGEQAEPVPAERFLDEIERVSRIRWMRALTRSYRGRGLDLIVKQSLIGKRYLEDLSDEELLRLHRDLDRARECLSEGVTFEDAGLLRSHG